MVGVGRPTLDAQHDNAHMSNEFWGIGTTRGTIINGGTANEWAGMEGFLPGDRIGLAMDHGRLTVYKNGRRLGNAVHDEFSGALSWVVCLNDLGDCVRVEKPSWVMHQE